MSSDAVIKSVARRLKYYFEVRRLEDGFDLSGVECPRLDHPPMRTGSTLAYDGLHDRSLKHYFSLPEVRHALTQFRMPGEGSQKRSSSASPEKKQRGDEHQSNGEKKRSDEQQRNGEKQRSDEQQSNGEKQRSDEQQSNGEKKRNRSQSAGGREGNVSTKVKKHMRRYHFFVSPLSPQYYVYTKRNRNGRTIHPDIQNTSTLRRQQPPHNGGRPVLRSVPPDYVSRKEAKRLIDNVSKLVVVTEKVAKDLEEKEKEQEREEAERREQRGDSQHYQKGDEEMTWQRDKKKHNNKSKTAPKSFESQDERTDDHKRSRDQHNKSSARSDRSASGSPANRQGSRSVSHSPSRSQHSSRSPESARRQQSSRSPATRQNKTTGAQGKSQQDKTSARDNNKKQASSQGNKANSKSGQSQTQNNKNAGQGQGQAKSGGNNKKQTTKSDGKPSGKTQQQQTNSSNKGKVYTVKRVEPKPNVQKADNVKDNKADDRNSRSSSPGSARSLSPHPPTSKKPDGPSHAHARPLSARKRNSQANDAADRKSLSSNSTGSRRSHSRESLDSEYKKEMEEAERDETAKQQEGSYELRVYTDADHASKLHGLRVVLCGDKMDSEVLELNTVANVVTNISGVERAIFDINTPAVGSLTGLKLGFANSRAAELAPRIVSVSIIDRGKTGMFDVVTKELRTLCNASAAGDLGLHLVTLRSQTDVDNEGVDGASRRMSTVSAPVINDSSADLKGAHTDRSSSSQGQGYKNTKPAEEEELPRAPSPLPIDRPITSRGPGVSHMVKEEDPVVAAAAAEVVPRPRRKDDFFDQSVKSSTYNVQLDPQSATQEDAAGGESSARAAAKDHSIKEGINIWTAAAKGDLDLVKRWIQYDEDYRTTLDERGRNVLHTAAACGELKIVEWLTKVIFDLDVESSMGHTAIQLAAQYGHSHCVKCLADMGANKDCRTSGDLLSPLHFAVKGGHLDTVKCLVNAGADINVKDSQGRTPRALAEQLNKTFIVDYLTQQAKIKRKSTRDLFELTKEQDATDDEDGSDVDAEEADDDYPATYKR